ncbi:MAG: two-component system, OmpR family, sensor histidine kinase MtrB [Actinomycetota bacterium]|nr:two-component system, OmpR family, sensor histidine kinase MtrB [Actinomycetota bacterium]
MARAARARRIMRLGLRARFTIAFALGGLILSALLASVTYGLVRENIVRQRETSATRQVYLNARFIRESLRTAGANPSDLLDGLQTPTGASPVLVVGDQAFAPSADRGRDEIPVALRDQVAQGKPARMRFNLNKKPQLAIGIPLPAVDAEYYEIVSLEELQRTLNSLGLALLAAAGVTTLAGAVLGATSSRQVLRPLSHLGVAAQAIAGGRLDTRVARPDDPDLAALIDSFNDMAGALQERIERDARFASDVSHELRSPLTTLAASLSVLNTRRDEMPERAQSALDLLDGDIARFTQLVEDLLEISKFDAGAAHLYLEDVRISELVLNAVGSTWGDVPVRVSSDAAGAIVLVDKRRLVRVIANLLDNAARYGDGATGVEVHHAGAVVEIAVEDRGDGVPIEERDRIFERFARGSGAAGSRGSGEGSGLGLALVREHVALHGGRVFVTDRSDGMPGSRFVIELPVVTSDDEPIEEEELPAAAVLVSDLEEQQQ